MPKEPIRIRLRNVPIDAHPNLEEEIRRHAYEIYEERGRQDGHSLDDWLLAEDEILGTTVETTAG